MSQILANGIPIQQNIKLVLFDKDGTLIDIHHYWASMIKIRASKIIERWFSSTENSHLIQQSLITAMGVNLETNRMKPEGPVGVKPRAYIVKVATQIVKDNGIQITNADMENLFSDVDSQTSLNLKPLLILLPGVLPLLQKLKTCKISMAVVSTDITSRTRKSMQVLELDDFFCKIIGGDEVANTKPAPDLAELVMQTKNYSPAETMVIGDHPVDIEMGESAGILTNIGVLTGLSDKSRFNNYECITIPDLTAIEVHC